MGNSEREAGACWEGNAEAWTHLARAGYDVYRDHLNTPAFLDMLPDVKGRTGLDVGCGEGHNTRLLAKQGAQMTALDISPTFIRYAREEEERAPLGIRFLEGSATELPFPNGAFDFAVAMMSLMDMPEIEKVFAEVRRVLIPGGFFQFSILHPCFDTPHRKNLRGEDGLTYAYEIGGYFRERQGEILEWTFSAAPPEEKARFPRFRVPQYTRMLSSWVNTLLDAGFTVERLGEPCPSDETVRACPHVQDAQAVAYFLHVRARKPASFC